MKKKLNILIADDHSLMRMGLSALIASEPDMAIAGEAENGKEAIRKTDEIKPDIVILDLMMPEVDGAEAARIIHKANPATGIIILTSFGDSVLLLRALANGATGVQLKESPTEGLIDAIRKVARGEQSIPDEVRRLQREDAASPSLTSRQMDILTAVAKGFNSDDIARRFGISRSCVKHHIDAIMIKLGAANRSEAVAIALRKQLLK